MKLGFPNRKQRILIIGLAFLYLVGGITYLDASHTLQDLWVFYCVFGVPAALFYLLLNEQKHPVKASMKKEEVRDPLFLDAVVVVRQYDRASASLLSRRLQISFNRALKLLDQLESEGIVGPADGAKPREVLSKKEDEDFSRN